MIKVVHVTKICIIRLIKIIMKQQNINRSMTCYVTSDNHLNTRSLPGHSGPFSKSILKTKLLKPHLKSILTVFFLFG